MGQMSDHPVSGRRQQAFPESAEPEMGSLGTVIAVGDGLFRVRLQSGQFVSAHLGGRLRLCPARLNVGDVVVVQVAAFDPSRGRIVRRVERKEST